MLAMFLLNASATTCQHTATSFACVSYVGNYDGDTLTVDIPKVPEILGHKMHIRINGIDTPEMKTEDKCEKAQAIKAKERIHLILSQAKRIDLKDIGRDKYFRLLADVVADGVSLKSLLLKEKLAVPYDGGTKTRIDWCSKTNQF